MAKKYVVDKKEPDKKKAKNGFFKGIGKFFKDTKNELKKVIWPTKDQLVKLSFAVVAFVVVFGAISGAFDYLMLYLIKLIRI